MAKQIFRQPTLERLASPEKLDTPARLVGAPGWLVLLGFIIALGFGGVWSLSVQAPVSVTAQGILIDRAGLVEVSADRSGRLEVLDLTPGAVVEAGAIVARMGQADLQRDLVATAAKLADARQRQERFETFFAEQKAREAQSDKARRGTIENTLAVLQERVVLLDERVATTAELFRKQVVVQDRLLLAQVAAADARERVSALEEEALRLGLAAVERESERRIRMLDEALAVEEAERDVERLTARLADQQVIRTTHAGRVVEVKVNAGDVIARGDALATLTPIDSEGELEAILYASPGEGKRITAGMVAEVSPSAVEREVFGFIVAEVLSVSPLPATPEGMRRTLRNDQLVAQLSAGGAPIEARVRLKLAETPTGFEWSASNGPSRGVGAGSLIKGKVIVDEVPVIDLLVPGLSVMLGADKIRPLLGG